MRVAPRLFLVLLSVLFGLGGAKPSSVPLSTPTLRTATPKAQQQQLIVFNAGSLTASFGDLLKEFTRFPTVCRLVRHLCAQPDGPDLHSVL